MLRVAPEKSCRLRSCRAITAQRLNLRVYAESRRRAQLPQPSTRTAPRISAPGARPQKDVFRHFIPPFLFPAGVSPFALPAHFRISVGINLYHNRLASYKCFFIPFLFYNLFGCSVIEMADGHSLCGLFVSPSVERFFTLFRMEQRRQRRGFLT